MKLATWNVNSIRARHDRVLAFLDREAPDVVCLQETKTTDKDFPFDALAERGYHATTHGQRTYNGVALLTKAEPADIVRGFDDGADEDPQTRLVAATLGGVRFISAYVPNGSSVGSDKWDYKLAWIERLRAYLDTLDPAQPIALCGDFNVAPDDERDVAFPDQWRGSVLTHETVRDALATLRAWGFVDAVRLHHHGAGPMTWWDYRRLGFQRGDGLRIDHIYATESLARRCVDAYVDRDERKGDKPSDHAPVLAVFEGG